MQVRSDPGIVIIKVQWKKIKDASNNAVAPGERIVTKSM